VAGSTKGIIHTATPPPPPAFSGVWRLSWLSQHGVDACWFPGSLSPRHRKRKRKRAPLYQNSPNSCKICLPSRKGDVGSSMEDDFIIASKTILYLFLFTPKYHCFDSYLSINVKRDNQMTEVQIELIASLCT
jgi:hypothetical protein